MSLANGKPPVISVIMSVHNGAAWLGESIGSILGQTFGDFEFIIVNDGSTDESPRILKEYASRDPRIILLNNEKNIGLMRSLNKGLDHARGCFIARMDSDDVSLPNRFQKQIRWFGDHPSASVVSTFVRRVDVNGRYLGYWMDDLVATDTASIKRTLPYRNCIAHPSIMIRSEVLRKFRYNEKISLYEDYELWLRIASAGYEFHKVPEVLLNYRLQGESMMSSSWKANPARVEMRMKREFLRNALINRKFGAFERQVLLSFATLAKIWIKLKLPVKLKKQAAAAKEKFALATRPVFRIGASPGISPANRKNIMFVVSSVRAGEDAEQFLKAARALSGEYDLHLVTTCNDDPARLRRDFGPVCKSITAPPVGLVLHSFAGVDAYLNRAIDLEHIDAIVLDAGLPGYHWLSEIQRRGGAPPAIDILHCADSQLNSARFKWVWPLLKRRICSSRKIIDSLGESYRSGQCPELTGRLRLVRDGIEYHGENAGGTGDCVLWLGQFSLKGDPFLFIEMAAELRSRIKSGVRFLMAGGGPLADVVMSAARQMGVADCLTVIREPDSGQAHSALKQARVLVMTSLEERSPQPALEAFACGVPVVSTAVGALDELIEDGRNGKILPARRDFAMKAADWIEDLMKHPEKETAARDAAHAADQYDFKSMVAGYIAAINEAIQEPNRN
ncbi:glycosyltransferase [bacterium]|nr:glycosyltransferase [bacterium]